MPLPKLLVFSLMLSPYAFADQITLHLETLAWQTISTQFQVTSRGYVDFFGGGSYGAGTCSPADPALGLYSCDGAFSVDAQIVGVSHIGLSYNFYLVYGHKVGDDSLGYQSGGCFTFLGGDCKTWLEPGTYTAQVTLFASLLPKTNAVVTDQIPAYGGLTVEGSNVTAVVPTPEPSGLVLAVSALLLIARRALALSPCRPIDSPRR